MKNLRIVFMGTPDFAVATLDALIKEKYNVVAVVTAPDKPAGRGRKLQQSAVKNYALENNLTILQPANLKNEDFLQELKQLQANLFIVVAFRMLPKEVWQMPKYGTFNLHASLLPNYRGAAPINWAIINGEKETGVTTFFIDEKIDTGNIILQQKIAILPTETVGELHDKLMTIGSILVVKTVQLIERDSLKTIPQPKSELTTAPKLNSENCKINWSNSVHQIFNHIRGLNPYPAAWTTLHNGEAATTLKLYDVTTELNKHQNKPGKVIIQDGKLKIAAADGWLLIDSLQLAGKRKMDAKSFINGYTFNNGAYCQ
jgi:methionyl-tRNA formyltransferase